MINFNSISLYDRFYDNRKKQGEKKQQQTVSN